MYDSILFPTDGSDTATAGLDYAVDAAAEHGSTVRVLHVVEADRTAPSRDRDANAMAAGEGLVEETAERIRARSVPVQTTVERGDPAETIVEAATDADLVVLGTHGRPGVSRALLGSVTEAVLETVPCPAMVVNPAGDRAVRYPCRALLVPTDGSDDARRALDEAIDIAAATGCRLHLLYVVESGTVGPARRRSGTERDGDGPGNQLLTAARERAEGAVSNVVTATATGHPHREIRRYVEAEGIELISLGTSDRTAFDRYALGGVSSKLLRTSPVPLVVTRTGQDR